MATRKLLDGSVREDQPNAVTCSVVTHCSRKWAFVDLETGHVHIPVADHPNKFHHPSDSDLACLKLALESELTGRELSRTHKKDRQKL